MSDFFFHLTKGETVVVVRIDDNNLAKILQTKSHLNPHQSDYFAFYSSWLGGITTSPHLMLVPVDDHMVHRGDAVFEAIKVLNHRAFLLEEHIQRLFRSAEKIGIESPWTLMDIQEILVELLKEAAVKDCFVRLFLSRGPGTFSVNPYDSIGAQLYIVCTRYIPYPDSKYEKGVSIGKSSIAAKESWFAQIKSCNYLHNVLMKKEAVDKGFDFMVAFDENSHLTESATENIVLVDQQNKLKRPHLTSILTGTTMMRTLDLASQHLEKVQSQKNPPADIAKSLGFDGVVEGHITENDLLSAKEVMMIGTTLDVLPVNSYQGQSLGQGFPSGQGNAAHLLLKLLREDILNGPRSISLSPPRRAGRD